VNISYLNGKEVEDSMQKVLSDQIDVETLHLFDKAQTEVYELMSTDPFQRFLRSEHAKAVQKKKFYTSVSAKMRIQVDRNYYLKILLMGI